MNTSSSAVVSKITPKHKDYVRSALQKYHSTQKVEAILLKEGWKKQDIAAALASVIQPPPTLAKKPLPAQSKTVAAPAKQAAAKPTPKQSTIAPSKKPAAPKQTVKIVPSAKSVRAAKPTPKSPAKTTPKPHPTPSSFSAPPRPPARASPTAGPSMASYLQNLLVSYCKNLLAKNTPPDEIETILKQAGWSPAQYQPILKKLTHPELANAPLPNLMVKDQHALHFNQDLVQLYIQGILYNYCKSAVARKVPEQTILTQLKNSGWKESQIKPILEEVMPKKIIVTKKGGKKEEKIADTPPTFDVMRNYIRLAIRSNIPLEKIRMVLIRAKWTPEQIRHLFEAAGFVLSNSALGGKRLDAEDIIRDKNVTINDQYSYEYDDIRIGIMVYSEKGKPNKSYHLIIPDISQTTSLILEEIRVKLIQQINLSALDISEGDYETMNTQIRDKLVTLVKESFPTADTSVHHFLVSYLISKVLGLGIVEIIKADENLEEIVINNSSDSIFVYHKKWGWCSTNQFLRNDEEITQLASMTGRKIGREITSLRPLLDAHLQNGDRVNATLKPVTALSPTITIRKFTKDPWTITKFLQTKTMDYFTAATIWMAIQFELSALVVGGTASGKTSCLNVLTNLVPPSQRVISIEDTREIRLPGYMHWVPMVSREANSEGKGGIAMEDLLVNSLRMRPDRIIVGEVRKREQAETLFEAIHTGHSVYATFHANDATEAIVRLTNPPVSVPKTMMPAISLIIVQFRNRRSGLRRTFQIAETTKSGDANILYQYNAKLDRMEKKNESKTLFDTLALYTGSSRQDLDKMMNDKIRVLKYLVKNNITSIENVGKVMSLYYLDKDALFSQYIDKDRKLSS